MKLWLVVPAYNEAKNLAALFERIEAAVGPMGIECTACVVDDGSADNTFEVAESLAAKHDIRILRHKGNQGLGAAFLTGMRSAVSGAHEDDAVIVLEGDGTSPPEIFPAMIEALIGECDIVIASRYVPGGKYLNFPMKRLLLSRCANWMLQLVCGLPGVRDYTIFYRAYRAGPLKRALDAYGDRFTSVGGFACNAEMLLRMRRFVREIREIPLIYDYAKKKGASGMKIGGNLASYLTLFRIFAFDGLDPEVKL